MYKIPVYILGLQSRYRGKNLEDSLRLYGIEFEVCWGIDGKDPLHKFKVPQGVASVSKFLSRPIMSVGELSCAQGHFDIYRKFINSGANWALIFEDDAILTRDPNLVLEDLTEFPKSSLVTLHSFSLGSEIPIKDLKSRHIINFQRYLEPHVTTSAYLISRAAAIRTLNRVTMGQISSRADWPIEMFPGIAFYRADHPIVFHDASMELSTIRDRLPEVPAQSGFELIFHRTVRLSGIASLHVKLAGVSYRSSYYVFVILPILRKLFITLNFFRNKFS